jgi:hypothetical protein
MSQSLTCIVTGLYLRLMRLYVIVQVCFVPMPSISLHLFVMVLLLKFGFGFVLLFCSMPRSSPLDSPFPTPDVLASLSFRPFRVEVHGFLHVDLRKRFGFAQVPAEQLESVTGQKRRAERGRSARYNRANQLVDQTRFYRVPDLLSHVWPTDPETTDISLNLHCQVRVGHTACKT